MGRHQEYKPGPTTFLVELPPDLNLDLHAFCRVHFRAPRTEITRAALRRFIDGELEARPIDREEFERVREDLVADGKPQLAVVRPAQRRSGSE